MEAVLRPSAWDLPLLVHVGGAMLLVGALVVALALSAASLRGGDAAGLTQLGFRVLLFGAVPSFFVMRIGAEWVASEADYGEPGWIGIGYATSDGGLLLIIVATVLAWRATRRGEAGPGRLGTAVVGLSALLLLIFTVTIWAMTAKPD